MMMLHKLVRIHIRIRVPGIVFVVINLIVILIVIVTATISAARNADPQELVLAPIFAIVLNPRRRRRVAPLVRHRR